MFVNDTMPFSSKKDMVIFRGKIRRSRTRKLFLEMYMDHPMCDCGVVGKDEGVPDAWMTPKKRFVSIWIISSLWHWRGMMLHQI